MGTSDEVQETWSTVITYMIVYASYSVLGFSSLFFSPGLISLTKYMGFPKEGVSTEYIHSIFDHSAR